MWIQGQQLYGNLCRVVVDVEFIPKANGAQHSLSYMEHPEGESQLEALPESLLNNVCA